MGFFSDLWDFIKSALKKVVTFLKKVFTMVYKGIKFVVQCIVSMSVLLKNSWFGRIIDGISFIFDLLDFLKSQGADVDTDNYKRELLDMDLDNYGRHTYEIQVS